MKNLKRKKALMILIFLVVLAAASALIMLLWNALIPEVIGWSSLTYWQAMGMLILCRLLVGSSGKMGMFHHHRGRFNQRKHRAFHEKFGGMSQEEKREYIRKCFEQRGHEPEC